jgi:NTE family protein
VDRKQIAIACQGGGSQCAFVAGALDALFTRRIQDRYEIVGLSGTSGGALTAAAAWQGLLQEARGDRTGIGPRILSLWQDLTAQTPQEIIFDKVCTDLMRLTERGMLPTFATSPASPQFQFWTRTVALLLARPEFTDLRVLLNKHIDFAGLPALVGPDSPVLLVGAGDVLEGNLKVFSSAKGEINVDSLMASAAIPNLFQAQWVEGHAYWDGIFATNPPIVTFLTKRFMGVEPLPEEIWIIQVNRSHHESVPETASDISDRRNHLAGNLSLQHEILLIDLVNTLIREGALTDSVAARFGVDPTRPITVRFIRMSTEILEQLDYPSKLSRQPAHIERLVAHGRAQADAFLDKIEGPTLSAEGPGAPAAVVENVEPRAPGTN